MKQLDWVPEVYARSGGLAADGFYKLLGRPRLDPLTVLVRETAQNSWDARIADEVVRFGIEGWSPMYSEEISNLREIVFPHASKTGTGLDKVLSAKRPFDGLIISDRGTRGLGGPVLADAVSPRDVYDWVDFVLNAGKANTAGHTGGTYGFGKTITYIVSRVSTIVIHSRTTHSGRPQSRLIACAIGKEFKQGGRLHTGRHWWGVSDDGAPTPVTGSAADEIATAIGMPAFASGELGTNILVIDPDWGGRTPQQALNFIAESVTWNLWPKLMSHKKRAAPMEVTISWNGDIVPVPPPEERPPLHGFAQAFRALLEGVPEGRREDGLERAVIRCQRPAKEVGDLVTVPLVTRPRAEVDDGHDEADEDSPASAAAIDGVCHHVAYFRTPELVVEYVPGPVPPEGGSEWAAVFKCRREVDEFFAMAEPPTHDSWRPELLPKSHGKTIVKVGLQRIRGVLESRWGVASVTLKPKAGSSTALVADELSQLIRAQSSVGAGSGGDAFGVHQGERPPSPSSKTNTTARRGQPTVEILTAGVALAGESPASEARVRVTPGNNSDATKVVFRVAAVLDETGEDPDVDRELEIVAVYADGADVKFSRTDGQAEIRGADPVDFTMVVRRSVDTTVSFDVQAEVAVL